MQLHHRREMVDMRSAYSHQPPRPQIHQSSEPPRHRTQRDVLSHSNNLPQPPPLPRHSRQNDRDCTGRYFNDRDMQESPRSSQETYASTVESEAEPVEEMTEYDVPDFAAQPRVGASNVLEATPADFSELFPSRRRLIIHHDDTTLDGNMNLRIDTGVHVGGERLEMTLFHLRMHDLKNRQFSLRRYCRDSGREVCHSSRKTATHKRPGFQRSLSNALNSMRPKSDSKSSTSPNLSGLARHDSGYGSMHSMDLSEDGRPVSAGHDVVFQEQPSSHIVKLEFSNYAHVEIKHAGTSTVKYEFEYWGVHYTWRRVVKKLNDAKEISFQLKKDGSESVLAKITPTPLTPRQAEQEQDKGGWIPPCSMRIEDDNILRSMKDVADVVVATGLMALVDDAIRTRFHSRTERQLLVPVPQVSMELDYISPKKLIGDMFNRKENHSIDRSRPPTSNWHGGRIGQAGLTRHAKRTT